MSDNERTSYLTQVLRESIEKDVFVVEEAKKSSSKSGGYEKWLFDFRAVIFRSEVLDAYAEIFFKRYSQRYPFQVCGLEMAAVPLVAAIVMKFQEKGLPLNGFFIRKSRKKHGLMKMVEGTLNDHPVIIVDDLVNRGASVIRQLIILKDLGKRVEEIFSILRFRDLEYYKKFKEENIKFSSIFDLDDFVESLGVMNLKESFAPSPIPSPFQESVLWKFVAPDPNFFYVYPKSGPVVFQGRVYFGIDSGYFICLDVFTGKTVWEYRVPFGVQGKIIFSTPAVFRGMIFFGAYDGNLYALDKNTGNRKWVFMEADWIGSSPCVGEDLNMVYIGLEYGLFKKMGGVSGLDARTGEKVWEFRSSEYTHGSPAYSKMFRAVGCGSNDGVFYLLDARSGKIRWSFQTEGPIKYAPRFVDEHGLVVVLGHGETVYVLDVKTGEARTQYKMDFGGYSTPLIIGNKVICTSFDKNVHCFDLFSGKLFWKFNTGARCFSTPELIRGKVYVGSNNGRLFELDPETGKATGIFYTAERIVNKIAYDENTGIFLVPTFANELIALKGRDW
jgi:outer membrane protein assembly factor BamB/orotate phosphoribosyltransferase